MKNTKKHNKFEILMTSFYCSGVHGTQPVALVVPATGRSPGPILRDVDPRGSHCQVLPTDRLERGGARLLPGGRAGGGETVSATYQQPTRKGFIWIYRIAIDSAVYR